MIARIRQTLARFAGRPQTAAARIGAGWARRDRATREAAADQVARPDAAAWAARRWGGATTDRLNSAHWSGATGDRINADLALYLPELRARCAYEAANNPFVEGVIRTHCIDVVGRRGPTFNVESESDAYNSALEDVFREWAESPTACGTQSFADMLRGWVRMEWIAGEHVSQMMTDNAADGPVKLRVLDYHPDRLAQPWTADGVVVLGIEIEPATGRPLRYYISRESQIGAFSVATGQVDPVPAASILHDFNRLEPGQVRGVPLLAPALSTIADLRDYDAQTLDAARIAADLAVLLTRDEDSSGAYENLDVSVPIERRQLRTLPPGWKPHTINPPQPATTYVQFRAERQRDIGRAADMPLMLVRLGSEDHNYSSARFDAQVYQRSVQVRQSRLERPLNRIASQVEAEASLAGVLPPRPPRVRFTWSNWQTLPHVDRVKEAKADSEEIAGKRKAVADVIDGNLDDHVRKLARERDAFAAAGLQWPGEAVFVSAGQVDDQVDDETDDNGVEDE